MYGFSVEYFDIGGRIGESGPTVTLLPTGAAAVVPPMATQALARSLEVAFARARTGR